MSQPGEWALKYRPSRFEEVLGQAGAVRLIGGYIKRHAPRDIFIRGATGTGKTTLARIYAKAIFCSSPTASGSPCDVCAACMKFAADDYADFQMLGRSDQTVDKVRQLIERNRYETPMEGGRRVILFDETGGSDDAYGALLSELEARDRAPCIFIFTGIGYGRMPEPLTDRLREISLAPASAEEILVRLRHIALAEKVAFEDEALELIAAAGISFRKAVNDLQSLGESGAVTVTAVAEELIRPRFGWVLDYFAALGRGDLIGELEALGLASQGPNEIADRILAFLTDVKLRFVASPTFGVVKLGVATDEERRGVLKSIMRSPMAATLGAVKLWDGLLAFWSMRPATFTEESLRAHAIRFHDRVHGLIDEGLGGALGKVTKAPATRSVARPEGLSALAGRSLGSSSSPDPKAFVSAGQALQLYDGASFALQVHDAPFNVLVRLAWGPKNLVSGESQSVKASQFAHHLQLRLKSYGGDTVAGFHRLVLHELAGGAWITTLVGHVPLGHESRLSRWLERPGVAERWGATITSKIAPLDVVRPKALERHWSLVRELWRGVDPTVFLRGGPALIDVLGVAEGRRRPAGVVASRRIAISGGLGPGAREAEAGTLAPALSAFAEREWDWLFRGWESAEFLRRKRARSIWASKVAVLRARHSGETELEAAALELALKKMQQKQRDSWSEWPAPWGASGLSGATNDEK